MSRLVFPGCTPLGLTSCLAVLCLVFPVQASPVTFTYTQSDALTGSGTITGTLDLSQWGGPSSLAFSGTIPPAVVVQNDPNTGFPVPSNAVGFMTQGSDANPGSGAADAVGVYLDLSGPPIVMNGVDGADTWTVAVPRVMISGRPYSYNFSVFDDPAGAGDVVGTYEFSGWPGDNGAGHRHTGQVRNFGVGLDSTSASASGSSLGSGSNGDALGFMAGLRATNDAPSAYPIFVDTITFGGQILADEATVLKNGTIPLAPPPESAYFAYTQTDAATGAGNIAVYSANGVLFTGAMPGATVVQNDATSEPLPPGIVGFITGGSESSPGANVGVHLGWSGTTTLIGEIRDDLDPNTATSDPNKVNLYKMDVALKAVTGEPHRYAFDTFDDNSGAGGTNDVTNSLTHRAWVGDPGDGHRQTGPAYGYGTGPDAFRAAASFNLGSHAAGDDLGITVGVGPTAPNGTLFVDQVAFFGVLETVGAPEYAGSVLAAARSGVITGVTVTGTNLASGGVSIETGAFAEDALAFTDRTHEWNRTPDDLGIDWLGLAGSDYLRFANDDRGVADLQAVVEMAPGLKNLFLLVDNRVGDASLLEIFNGNPFADTGADIGIDENGTGVVNRTASLYVLPNFEGTSITLGPQNDGTDRNMYGFLVQPLSIPEPATTLLLVFAAAHLLLFRRRR